VAASTNPIIHHRRSSRARRPGDGDIAIRIWRLLLVGEAQEAMSECRRPWEQGSFFRVVCQIKYKQKL